MSDKQNGDHAAKLSARAGPDGVLKPEIRRGFTEKFEVYGVRKTWRQLAR